VHLQALGHPIVGDPLYGSANGTPNGSARMHLHATALALTHPFSGEPLRWCSPVPFPRP
jgi:tRNA pseudouridine32 synthase/23S rRNA pseudouridine746 synthase